MLTALLAALAATLVTASPVGAGGTAGAPASSVCSGSLRTAAAYTGAFGALAGSATRYVTADGFVPVPLPDGRTAWLMSDTLLGPPAAPAAATPGTAPTFVHNSIVVQRGRCLTPVLGGTAEARADLVPEVYGRWCWQSAGVARRHTLLVFCTLVESASGPPGFAFQVVGSAIATFRLPDLTFTRLRLLPFAEPTSGAGTAAITWGTGTVLVGDTVYVYGAAAGGTYVARTQFGRLLRGPWTFWDGRHWAARATAMPLHSARGAPVGKLSVTRTHDGYVAVAFPHALPDPRIAAWTATRPQGPWRARGIVARAQVDAGQFAYDARVADLDGPGWTVVYSVNDPVGIAQDPSRYGGRFTTPNTELASLLLR